MKNGLLIYVTTDELKSFRWRAGHLEHDGKFANDEAGHRQFAHHLASAKNETLITLVNIAEENFVNETIPNLRGDDRASIIRRRLEQRFPDAQFTASLSLGLDRSAGNSEHLLLAAFTRHENIAPWLRLIASASISLSAIYSPSFLAPALMRIIRPDERNCLLLTQQDASIRQSHIKDGKLQFSRLTSLSGLTEERIAERFIEAATRLRLFLISQRLLDHGTPLTTCMIAPPSIAAILRSYSQEDGARDFIVIDIAETFQRAGIKSAPTDSGCETLFLALAALSPPKVHYADVFMRRETRLRSIRRYLFGAGEVAMAASLLVSIGLHLQIRHIETSVDQDRQDIALIRARLETLQRALPVVPVDNAQIQSLIVSHHHLLRQTAGPAEIFQTISHALVDKPGIVIESIDWALENNKSPVGKETRIGHETAVIRGHAQPDDDKHPRTGATQLRQFVAALKEAPQLNAKMTRQPVGETPSLYMPPADAAQIKTASFIIELSRNRKP
ncbi:hypothetical protein [Propionivibrio dicarboxylicus]|uniref:Uncharacterized protein n=1 Tax=Propionivibrio dicarboxylicus TaxID=83767 RepID=A0A1G8FTV1_9RHOO|nr:hypothetical protein [Propionivibrio dicarboxylicus]SDH85396.1 hypothetical protein SAMN05660652_02421 [Propionivibrio dicarboxylicus]